jgi:hypothetical protein
VSFPRLLPRPLLRLLAVALGLAAATAAHAEQAPEEELKAAFIYHFVQFTQWPKDTGPQLTICAGRGSPLYAALEGIAGKPANDRRIALRPLADPAPGDCQVIVAGEADRSRLPQIKRASDGLPVLTVSDDPELAREGMIISMAVESGRISFSIDNTRAGKAGLVISSRLLRLAKGVQ